MTKGQKLPIYLLLVFVMLVWGLNVIATKLIVATFQPITITGLRVFTAGVCVFIILSFIGKIRKPTKKEFIFILSGALFNVVIHQYTLAIGLSKTSASNGGLILGLGPILTTIVAFLFLRNKVTLFRVFGIILGFSGVSFIVLEGDSGISGVSIGDLYVFIAILAQAISFVMIKKASETMDPRLMTGYMLVIGSIIVFFIGMITEPTGLSSIPEGSSFGIWLIFLGSAVISTAIGHMSYNYAIGKVGVSESAIFINLNPFFALVGAFLFLGENISFAQIFGFIFILFGVLFGSGAVEDFLRESKLKAQKHPIKVKRTV